jgi:ABC-type nitrate/sulfonate/bicarbonate transport system permease component
MSTPVIYHDPSRVPVDRPSLMTRIKRITNLILPVVGVTVAAATWQVLANLSQFSTGLPPFTSTFIRAMQFIEEPQFLNDLGTTVSTALIGFVLTVAIALPLGLVMALSPQVDRVLGPFVEILRPIPPVVYLPIAVLALGVTSRTALVLVLSGSLWPLLIQVVYGVRSVDNSRLDVADVYGLTHWQKLRYVIIAGAMPYVLTGLRLTATICLVVTVTAEMLGTKAGLGGDMAQSQVTGDNTRLFALVLVIGLIGLLVDLLGRWLEHKSLRWQQARSEGVVS